MHPLSTRSLAVLCALTGARQADDWQRVELAPEQVALARVELPDPPWRSVGEGLELSGGARHAASRLGDGRLALDLDGDGVCDGSFGEREGLVRLRPSRPMELPPVYPIRLRRSELDGRWEWAPAMCARGRLGDTTIAIYDLDGDGRYDGYGSDAMWIGSDRSACYLSAVVAAGEELLELVVSPDATFAGARPWRGPTGRVDLRSAFRSRGQLESAILVDGELAFEVGRARAPVLLPAGTWTLARGRARAGAGSVRIEAGELGPIVVEPDVLRVLEWGAPVAARCDAFFEDGLLHVLPFTVEARGRAGARYVDFSPRRGRATLAVREADSGRELGPAEHLPDADGGWGALIVRVPPAARLEVELRLDLPVFGAAPVEVVENPAWRRRDLGLR